MCCSVGGCGGDKDVAGGVGVVVIWYAVVVVTYGCVVCDVVGVGCDVAGGASGDDIGGFDGV